MEGLLPLRFLDMHSFRDRLQKPRECLSQHLSAPSVGQRAGELGQRTGSLSLVVVAGGGGRALRRQVL